MEMEMESGKEQSEFSRLLEDIMSLEKERKELLQSLTPTISLWEDTISTTTTSRVAGKGIMAENTSPVQKKMESLKVRDDEKEFVNYFDFMVQDTEDFGHRMLSMSQFLWSSHATISPYKAQELDSLTSKLQKLSKDLYKSTEETMEKRKEDEQDTAEEITEKMKMLMKKQEEKNKKKDDEEREMMLSNEFLRLSSNVMERPYLYKNELAMLFTKEEEEEYERLKEAEREAERVAAERETEWKTLSRRQRKQRRNQEIVEEEPADELETIYSPTEQIKESMNFELRFFDGQRRVWERSSGSKPGGCGGFEDKTRLSPMQFTHCTPGTIPPYAAVTASTLQIYSLKIVQLSDSLNWPLYVYGVVAARDTVDRNRNLLFSRSSFRCQVLTQNDCSLCLTGPSRAILAMDPVDFELELRLHDGDDERKDRDLICVSTRYNVDYSGEQTSLTFHSPLCTAELRLERLPTTVQATILSVRVVGGGSPFKSGGQVACSSSTADATAVRCEKVVLLDFVEEIPIEDGLDGYLPLSRNVVSVELQGGLTVVVKAYAGSGHTSGHVYFPSQYCNISLGKCSISGSEVEIVVAWSRLVRDKMDMLIEGYATQV